MPLEGTEGLARREHRYLIRQGLCEAHKAVSKIQELRKYTEDHDEPSPESWRQYEMVISWVEGE